MALFDRIYTSCNTWHARRPTRKWKWSLRKSPSSGSSQETDRDGGEEADSLTRQPETIDVGEGLSQRKFNEE